MPNLTSYQSKIGNMHKTNNKVKFIPKSILYTFEKCEHYFFENHEMLRT